MTVTDLRPPLPGHVQVEVTAACNLRCQMCLVSYRPPLSKLTGTMGLETFKRVIDDLPHLERVTLQGLGEPLLVPHLVDMVAYVAARGAAVGFNTNGMLLSPARAEALIAAGLSWLHVSLDGATAETYESIRGRSDFQRVVGNLRALGALRRGLGTERPHVELVLVAMRRNVGELPGLVRLAADVGVDRLRVQNLSHSFSDTDPAGDYAEIRAYAEAEALWQGEDPHADDAFAEAAAAARALGLELRLPDTEPAAAPRPAGAPGCDWPWTAAYITHDGTVQPCCMVMGADRVSLGSIHEAPLEAVWHAQPYEGFRARLLTDEPPDVCVGCSAYRHVF